MALSVLPASLISAASAQTGPPPPNVAVTTSTPPAPVIVVPPPAPTTTVAPPSTTPDTLPPATTAPPVTATPLVTTTPPAASAPPATPAPPSTVVAPPPTTRPPRPTTTFPPTPVRPAKATKVDESVPKRVPSGATYIEVSIRKQRMYLYKGGELFRTVRVSTGNGKKFCEKGKCGVAHTPRGRFRVYNRINGWRESYLGKLYNPLYFSGGYAIHGSQSVPSYPASHGCVRITMTTAKWLPTVVPNGTPVYVHD